MHKLCIPITGPSYDEACQQVEKARKLADLLEFRLDMFRFSEQSLIQQLQENASIPVIFTFRQSSYAQIKPLLALKPDYIDLEGDIDPDTFKSIQSLHPEIQLICSLHDFEKTPHDLTSLLQKMLQCPAHLYKIATMAHSSLDAMRMLRCVKDQAQQGRCIIGICMGEKGQLTRILGCICGNALTYAALDASCQSAPGQLDAEELIHTYGFRQLNPSTRLFGLIGDPIQFSRSHLTHNGTMRKRHLNSVYVKIQLKAEEIKEFLIHAEVLGFEGLSVTMPLKEAVGSHLDACRGIADDIGAVNTITISPEAKVGYNTDGEAVVELLQEKMPLQQRRVVLLGAGGAAKAIACALYKQGAKLVILNRTLAHAQQLAEQCEGEAHPLSHFFAIVDQGYDILINCTSVGMTSSPGNPVPLSALLPNRLVMDIISHPKETPLLLAAREKNCTVIPGEQVFLYQAEKQFSLWFGSSYVKIFNELIFFYIVFN